MRRQGISFFAVFLLVSMAGSMQAFEPFWRPYVEMETRGGEPWAEQATMFLPLLQDGDGMLFADLRGHWTDHRAAQGGWGLAYRQMLVNGWIFGVHGAFDLRHSEYGNNFDQGVAGLEFLNETWGLRCNGYFPGDKMKTVPGKNIASIVGSNIEIQQAAERAYEGVDFEIEARLWMSQFQGVGNWWAFQDIEIWGAAGAFHFENGDQGIQDITGPRARFEVRFFDIPVAGPDSRVVFSGEFEHDDVRGSVGTGSLTIRIPFGPGGGWYNGPLRGLNRRMVAPIERENDIVTDVSLGAAEGALLASTGQAVSTVITVDADTGAATIGDIAAAGSDSIVIASGGAGIMAPGGAITLQPGQVLMGGGSDLALIGATTGAAVNFRAPGSRPTINSGGSSTLIADDDNSIISVDLVNSGAGVSGIVLNDATGVLIQDVGISVSGLGSTGILSSGDTDFTLNDSSIITSGIGGNGIQSTGNSIARVAGSSISTSGDGADGIGVAGNSQLVVSGSTIFTSGAGSEGVFATDNARLTLTSSTVTVTGALSIGVLATPTAGNDLRLLVGGNTISSTSHGVSLDGAAGTVNATLTNNTITSAIGFNEIDVAAGAGTVINLSATGNALTPLVGTISLDESAGGDINVTESAPFTISSGIDTRNGIPGTNVLVPGGAIDYNQPVPLLP